MTSSLTLTFHGLTTQNSKWRLPIDSAGERYLVAKDLFEAAIAEVDQQYNCTASDFFQKKSGNWTVITFDDGLITDFEVGFPLLLKSGLTATFFVTTSNIGANGYCSQQRLREMAEGGMEVGSHGLTHSYLVNLGREQARREIVESKERLEQVLGGPVFSYAPVGGHFDGLMVQDAYNAGYRCFASMIPGLTVAQKTGFVMRRNHVQSCHDAHYLRRLLARESGLLFKNTFRYRLLFAAKRILGMRRYDRLKSKFIEALG